jgi:hypothetical protein
MAIRSAFCVLLLLAWSPACSRSEAATADRRLESDQYDVDLGRLGQAPVTKSVVLKSTGREPVTIARIGTYSGSITTRLRTSAGEFQVSTEAGGQTHCVLSPGQTALLEITVDPKGMTESHGRRITVHSDDSVESALSIGLSLKAPPAPPVALAQARTEDGPPPHIAVSEDTIDFGDIFTGEVPRKIIKVSNKGEGNLVVRQVRSTCGCTAARKVTGGLDVSLRDLGTDGKELVLKPGEETDIEISLDSSKMNGPLLKEVHIESNDVERNPITVTIKARAVKPVEMQPERLTFGRVMHYTAATQSVIATSTRLKDFGIANIVATQPWVKVAWNKVDDPGTPDAIKYKIDVTITGDAPVGAIQDPLTIQTSSQRVAQVLLPMAANVVVPITFDTGSKNGAERIDFGVLKGDTSVTREVHITNGHSETPYVITSAEIDSVEKDHFTSAVEAKTQGQEYIVRITAKPSLSAHYFKGWLVLKSDHPDLLEKRIPFQGWVTRS